jgi:4-hydroxyproline epimerase
MQKIYVIDSHTCGEPTRTVINNGLELGTGTVAQQRAIFQANYASFRSTVINEPRGNEVLVGALLTTPSDARCIAGVIFFNNVGTLHMCGHGTIGVARTLAHMGKIGIGKHYLETPVGIVGFEYHGNEKVTIENVASYRHLANVPLAVPGLGTVHGDIAWGGNWFFLVEDHHQTLHLSNIEKLTEIAWNIRCQLIAQKITGENNGEIDHIELIGPAENKQHHARNFVLCPGKAYDRSPCGTGTSAKLACLAADGKLDPHMLWRQESILGTVFEGSYRYENNLLIPSVTGAAYITAETTLIMEESDPFKEGIRA